LPLPNNTSKQTSLTNVFSPITKDFDVGVKTALLFAVDKDPKITCPGAMVFVVELNNFLVLALVVLVDLFDSVAEHSVCSG
jgi:hypothetical protein